MNINLQLDADGVCQCPMCVARRSKLTPTERRKGVSQFALGTIIVCCAALTLWAIAAWSGVGA